MDMSFCGPASRSPVRRSDVIESREANIFYDPVQCSWAKLTTCRCRKGLEEEVLGLIPHLRVHMSLQHGSRLCFSCCRNQVGGLQPAETWVGSALPTSFPGPSPFPPGWNPDHPVPGWSGRHQERQEWTQLLPWPPGTPACPPCIPLQLLLQRRGEGHSSGASGEGQLFAQPAPPLRATPL